ncbi:MAG TPA: alpha-L-arabinofuranosidase C-terminal domain-containing protein [Polyangiaceae bacterium]|nr:alpha-L-arabinofuranosidase C-terminal domain-containing protein [Polyangiaceae bacterium]
MISVPRSSAWRLALCLLILNPPAFGQAAPPAAAKTATAPKPSASFDAALTIRADQPGAKIDPRVYGSFAEHLGRGIYEGIWVGEGSPIPNTRGMRNDVIAALRKLQLPLLRWPGGCFADEYHWRDGIGPRNRRPRRANTWWGGPETNAFGLHEFMDFAELIGTEPYVSINVGSGSPREMAEWLEYMTSDSDSELAQLRRKNGRQKPWKVKLIGIGNENWGCGGNMRAEFYADTYKQFATFVKKYSDTAFERIASGPSDEQYAWTSVLMAQATKFMDGLSLHYYTLPTGNWDHKGSATHFGEPEWHATMMRTLRMGTFLNKHSAIMDKYDPQKHVALVVDEWGTWYDTEPGASPLYQQNTLRDALVAAINLNLFNQHSDRVRAAASAQAINVLQALILTKGPQMVLTPTYHVYDLYRVHRDALSLPVELQAPRYVLGQGSVPTLHASASRDARGVVHVSIANLDPNRSAQLKLKLTGAPSRKVSGRTLTASNMTALNDFGAAPAVTPASFESFRIEGEQVLLTLPSKSVTVVSIE